MTLEWKRRKDGSGFAYYAAPAIGGAYVARVSAFTLDGRRLWGATVRHGEERRDVHAATNDPAGYYGAWRTMKAAKAAAEAAYAEMCRAAAMREEMTNYREAGRAGNAEGRAYFAGVKSGRYAAPAQNPRDYGSLAEHARMASATYCGVYAPHAKREAFAHAFRAGYLDAQYLAEQAAKPAEIVIPEGFENATREAAKPAEPVPHPFAERRPAIGRVPARVAFLWEELTEAQRFAVRSKSLPGFHPSNIPDEAAARRAVFFLRAENLAGLDMGIGENFRRAEEESRIRREARANHNMEW